MFEKRLILSNVLLFVLFSSSFVTLVGASSVMWSQTYGGTESEAAWAVIEVSTGGFAVARHTESFGAGRNDVWLIQTDEMGIPEFSSWIVVALMLAMFSIVVIFKKKTKID